ncbi:hypothetical protein HPB52_012542 [Rhipicephalus sanguineus]|uniref:t-SNARE coiled-coil homology domain-containing protein n=1 Tax=Rhipicephalus sanguineus TaxID=34632 RepID=A0A9D4PKD2_RHISA|nr:hypothetical protein HPB52_012542 [Rhipicephalus sanguineus]
MADAETDEQRFVRELRRLLAEPDDENLQGQQEPQYRTRDDPSIAATRNLLRACQEAQGIGLRTVAVLESQGGQLDNVSRALDKLSVDLDSAEGHLSQKTSLRPLSLALPVEKEENKKDEDKTKPSQQHDPKRASKARKPSTKSTTNDESVAESTTGSVIRTRPSATTADSSAATERVVAGVAAVSGVDDHVSKRRQSLNDADELGATLTSLKGIAQACHRFILAISSPPNLLEMGEQLSAQNEQIDELTASAASSEERIRRASGQADKILRDA